MDAGRGVQRVGDELRILDMFSGLGGWAAPFRDRGHRVATTDLDSKFGCDITADVRELAAEAVLDALGGGPDVILASPPCEGFSVMNIGKNWGRGHGVPAYDPEYHRPKTETAQLALALVERTRELIAELEPLWFVIENPRAKLRRLPVVADLERRTVWYCHYAETNAKPTDLWGGFPRSFVARPECHNADPRHPLDCCCRDHAGAPRGSRTPGSVQGKGSPEVRAEIPYALGEAVCIAAETDHRNATFGPSTAQGSLWDATA